MQTLRQHWLLITSIIVAWLLWRCRKVAVATTATIPPPADLPAPTNLNVNGGSGYGTMQGYARGDTSPASLAALAPESVDWLNTYSYENADMPGPMGALDAYNYLNDGGFDTTEVTAALSAAMLRPHV